MVKKDSEEDDEDDEDEEPELEELIDEAFFDQPIHRPIRTAANPSLEPELAAEPLEVQLANIPARRQVSDDEGEAPYANGTYYEPNDAYKGDNSESKAYTGSATVMTETRRPADTMQTQPFQQRSAIQQPSANIMTNPERPDQVMGDRTRQYDTSLDDRSKKDHDKRRK